MKLKFYTTYLIFYGFTVWLMALWTNRNLDFWLSHVTDKPVDVPFWMSIVFSIVSPISLFLNIVGEILKSAI